MIAPTALIVFALLGATVAPRVLRRAAWPESAPRLGILLWQALSFSVVAAVVLAGAALALPAVPFSTNLADFVSACGSALRAQYSTPGGAVVSTTGGLIVVAVLARIGYCATGGIISARRERRRHADALALAARHDVDRGVLVVDHGVAAAYCLPGRGAHVVLTTAALDALDEAELVAVLAHERAHLRARHHLVLAVSVALQRAFPVVPLFRDAHTELTRLVEMHADDVACRGSDRLNVATALVRLAESSTPTPALGAGGTTALTRVRRLVAPSQPLGAMRSLLTAVAVGAVLIAPLAIASAPALAAATVDLCPVDFSGTGL